MSTIAHYVGLDVHAESISIAVAGRGDTPVRFLCQVPNDLNRVWKQFELLGPPDEIACVYEAGPTGFGLQRALEKRGVKCVVAAPSKLPKVPGERMKTDRRDATSLAGFLRAGLIKFVAVPDEETEAVRDLERAREDAKCAQRTARHQLSKFLLRHGRHYTGGKNWSRNHFLWIAKQKFDQPVQQAVLADYLQTVNANTERVQALDRQIEEAAKTWSKRDVVKTLRGLRGIDTLSAVVLAAEIGDFHRFPTARSFMGYLGLTPSVDASGQRLRNGPITRAGNGHARRILIEAAWSYRHTPVVGAALRQRSAGLSPEQKRLSWKAQQRLHTKYRRLQSQAKAHNKIVTAVARELAGFVWALARLPVSA